MSRRLKITSFLIIGLVLLVLVLNSAGVLLLGHDRDRIVKSTADIIREYHVSEEDANRIADFIVEQCAEGEYWTGFVPELLWTPINTDLRLASGDEHFLFVSSPDFIELAKSRINHIDIYNDADRARSEKDNHGIVEAKMMEAGIGYLRLDRFANPLYGKDSLLKVLEVFDDATAMIVDLRYNSGGFVEQTQILFSYFTDTEDSVLISAEYFRFNDSTIQFWSISEIGGRSFDRDDVYVLVSNNTFSAGEGFAYDMKHHQTGVIVGEPTRGGAHSVLWHIIEEDFVLRVPAARGIHPVTGTDWEGVGVIPDIEISSGKALDEALRLIEENRLNASSSSAIGDMRK